MQKPYIGCRLLYMTGLGRGVVGGGRAMTGENCPLLGGTELYFTVGTLEVFLLINILIILQNDVSLH